MLSLLLVMYLLVWDSGIWKPNWPLFDLKSRQVDPFWGGGGQRFQ